MVSEFYRDKAVFKNWGGGRKPQRPNGKKIHKPSYRYIPLKHKTRWSISLMVREMQLKYKLKKQWYHYNLDWQKF